MNQKDRLREILKDDPNRNFLVEELLNEICSDETRVSISDGAISAQNSMLFGLIVSEMPNVILLYGSVDL